MASLSPFGDDTFGRFAEKTARFFGTPRYIIGQTIVVALWILFNTIAFIHHWDARPFILLNLIFSTQAAYAAPLILLAQTRQADRDKIHGDRMDKRHTTLEELAKRQNEDIVKLLESNTSITQEDKQLTEEVAKLTREIHALLKQR
ncbi:MAG TPA: DUF1003 domain-containing protein [Gaiellaceae bacterium]|jgi:uncharacterized membrane protein